MARVYERQEIITYEYVEVEKETPIERELKEELRKYRYDLNVIVRVLDTTKDVKTSLDLFLSMTSHKDKVPSGVHFLLANGYILYPSYHESGYNWVWLATECSYIYIEITDYDHNLYREENNQ